MKYQKGSTLLEILLYISLYSFLFTGYVSFVFTLQKTIHVYQGKYEDIVTLHFIKSLVTSYVDRSEGIQLVDGEVSEYLKLNINSKEIIFDQKLLDQRFGFNVTRISFKKLSNVLQCIVTLYNTEHVINIPLL